MAQKVHITLVDDIDGSDAAETVRFGLDNVVYEIDLSEAHAKELRDALAPWVEHARRRPGQRATRRTTVAASGKSDAAKIRAWAQKQGIKVSDRGRIPADIRERYLVETSA